MQYLTFEDVVAFYREAIGEPDLRYPDGLESAIGRPQQSAFGEDAYPTLPLKTAALMQSLAENQSFVDGNKRSAACVVIPAYRIHAFFCEVSRRRRCIEAGVCFAPGQRVGDPTCGGSNARTIITGSSIASHGRFSAASSATIAASSPEISMSIVMRIGRTDRHPVIAEPSNMVTEPAYINNRNQRARLAFTRSYAAWEHS